MMGNSNLDKTVTSFEYGENISMSDFMRNYDKTDNADFEKELEVTIVEENADGFLEGVFYNHLFSSDIYSVLFGFSKTFWHFLVIAFFCDLNSV